jgi:hypothetical protein
MSDRTDDVQHTLDQLKKSLNEGVYEAIVAALVDKVGLTRDHAECVLWCIAAEYIPFVKLDEAALIIAREDDAEGVES